MSTSDQVTVAEADAIFASAEPRSYTTFEVEDILDPFDSLLSLEDTFYAEGHALGVADGSRAGRIEGRLFGLEKGFDKFVEIGQLHGRAQVWQSRVAAQAAGKAAGGGKGGAMTVEMKGGERLKKHVERLSELTDPQSLETRNDDEAVQEAEERLAGGRAKFTLISRIVGEGDGEVGVMLSAVGGASKGDREGSELEVEVGKDGRARQAKGKKGAGEMEDFVGLPMPSKRGGTESR